VFRYPCHIPAQLAKPENGCPGHILIGKPFHPSLPKVA
jgi:hypothetical protein